jgi:hypothetical protein
MLRDGTIDVQHLGRVDAVPWADRIGGDSTDGSIEICSRMSLFCCMPH